MLSNKLFFSESFFSCLVFVDKHFMSDLFFRFNNMNSDIFDELNQVDEVELLQEALGSGAWNMTFDHNAELISVTWSQVFRRMIGYKDESDFPNNFEAFEARLHEDDRERVVSHYWNAVKDYTNRTIYDTEYRFLTRNRGYRWFHAAGRIARREDGSPISIVGFFVDIDDKKKSEERVKAANKAKSEQLRILQSLANMYYSMHLINLQTGSLTEFSNNEELKSFFNQELPVADKMRVIMENVIVPQYRKKALEFTDLNTLRERMKGLKTLSSEFVGIYTGWFLANFITIDTDKAGYPTVVLFTTQVIDERKRQEHVLFLRSVTDDMTGFLNRRAYEEELVFYRKNPIPDNLIFVVFDINQLKYVNDNLGHAAGDELICGFSEVLAELRSLYGENAKIFRTGGDEFVGIFFMTPEEHTLTENAFNELVNQWQGKLVKKMSIAYGKAFSFENPEYTIDDLARIADKNMYEAKSAYYSNNGLDRRRS